MKYNEAPLLQGLKVRIPIMFLSKGRGGRFFRRVGEFGASASPKSLNLEPIEPVTSRSGEQTDTQPLN